MNEASSIAKYLDFGVFSPPFFAPRLNPTLAIAQDLLHVEEFDRLGYNHQFWFGEHYTGGAQFLAQPVSFLNLDRTRAVLPA
jgi:limonene 1,2-monooxygenase